MGDVAKEWLDALPKIFGQTMQYVVAHYHAGETIVPVSTIQYDSGESLVINVAAVWKKLQQGYTLLSTVKYVNTIQHILFSISPGTFQI
jgi:hypothetical protein